MTRMVMCARTPLFLTTINTPINSCSNTFTFHLFEYTIQLATSRRTREDQWRIILCCRPPLWYQSISQHALNSLSLALVSTKRQQGLVSEWWRWCRRADLAHHLRHLSQQPREMLSAQHHLSCIKSKQIRAHQGVNPHPHLECSTTIATKCHNIYI